MRADDGPPNVPYSLSEAKAVAEHRQSAYWDEYHRHLYEWLISEVVRLRSDEWLEKALVEILARRPFGPAEFVLGMALDVMRKHRDGPK